MISESGLDQAVILATSDGEIPESSDTEKFIHLGAVAEVPA
jgi:hypothetical protein